ncbi:MAG: hypothetical protein VX278_03900 [Myxococcota bacterium]|nr:hypothetical protein [Myxococcota bacterium]
MRIAVYGGSFNPPHVAHAMVASWLLWTDQVDEVWMVPVFRHAFESTHDKRLAPYTLRLAWCQQMQTDVDVRIKVSDIESSLPVPSYSINTLDALQARHPEHRFSLVIGADVIPDLPKWNRWDKIESRYSPIIVGRGGYDSPKGAVSFPTVSSSAIRKQLREGVIPRTFLSSSMVEMLEKENPYLQDA